MSDLTNNVIVNVSINDTPLSQKAFGIGAIVSTTWTFTGQTKVFKPTSLADMALDLTGGTADPAYRAASVIASQQQLLTSIVAIKDDGTTMTDTLTAAASENNEWLGVASVDRDEQKQSDMAAYAKANKKFAFTVADDVSIITDPVLTDNANVARLVLDADLITANTADVTVNTLAATSTVFITDHDTTMAAWIANISLLSDISAVLDAADLTKRTIIITHATTPIAITSEAITGGATQANILVKLQSLAAKLNGLNNDQTMLFYHSAAEVAQPDEQYIDMGAMGRLLPQTPGSYTAKNFPIFAVTPDNLSDSEQQLTFDKAANVFVEIANQNVPQNGTVSSGGFMDNTIFRLWIEARVGENVFKLQVDSKKIPFTTAGITLIGTAIEAIFKLGQNNGGIGPHEFDDNGVRIGGYEIILPRLQDVLPADKAARILRDVEARVYLAGAIHLIIIDISLQL